MTYLGIDLSLTGTGLALLSDDPIAGPAAMGRSRPQVTHYFTGDSGGTQYLDAWLIETTPKMGELERWKYIARAVMACARAADVIAIEGYSFASKFSGQLHAIHELGGIVKFHLQMAGKGYQAIPPTVLKKFIAGKGGADKSVMLKEIYRRYGVDFDDHNMADAFGLAKIGEAMHSSTGLPQFQLEVIEGIRNPKRKKGAA